MTDEIVATAETTEQTTVTSVPEAAPVETEVSLVKDLEAVGEAIETLVEDTVTTVEDAI
jgi:hypothetical protein